MVLSKIIILCCLFAITVSTTVNVELNLKCKSKEHWRYNYEIYEHDSLTKNDIIVSKNDEWVKVDGESSLVKTFDYAEGDGWRDGFYEFFFEIHHNCGNYTQKHVKSRYEEKNTRLYISIIPIEADHFNTTISTYMDVFGDWNRKEKKQNSKSSPYRRVESSEEE